MKITLFGKSCIVKTLAVSKLIYVGSILGITDNTYIKKVQRLIYNFIWGKTERIKTLIGSILNGGLSIVYIECKLKALKAAWVSRLLKSKGILYKILDGYCKMLNINIHITVLWKEDYKHWQNEETRNILSRNNECKANPVKMSSDEIMQQPIIGIIVTFNIREIHYSSKTGLPVGCYMWKEIYLTKMAISRHSKNI